MHLIYIVEDSKKEERSTVNSIDFGKSISFLNVNSTSTENPFLCVADMF